MIPVLSASAIREADARTIANEPITSWALMERAAQRCTERIVALTDRTGPCTGRRCDFVVIAGMGNNGGDGLAIARLLKQRGRKVRVLLVQHRAQPSPDHAENLRRSIERDVEVARLSPEEHGFAIAGTEVIIDALFGIGMERPVEGWIADVIRMINGSQRPVIAIDMPSGLPSDLGIEHGAVIRAERTLTFEVPKPSFFLPENDELVGDWELIGIGLDRDFLVNYPTEHHLIEEEDVITILRPRPRSAHKGQFGHALLVAGSKGRMGAAVLATQAALRSGVGLLTTHLPAIGLGVVQTVAPEAMCSVDPMMDCISQLPELGPYSGIGIGPGISVNEHSAHVVKNLIQVSSVPCVIDADGLNLLGENPTWLAFLPKNTILTPHPKELDRLVGKSLRTGTDRLAQARQLAVRSQCYVVLKGARTAICDPTGHVFFNTTGNQGMAKGGSGDALTGILTGLLAQGYSPLEACLLGVHTHGLAGDLAARSKGMDGMTAGDLIEHLPAAWQRLRDLQNNMSTSPLP